MKTFKNVWGSRMRFEKIIVVGSGKIAADCIKHLSKCVISDKLLVVESEDNSLSVVERICRNSEINYTKITNKVQMEQYLISCINEIKALIISANNCYIFTKKILEIGGVNLEIINMHYGLLPNYRGVNIPTWAIFNQERQTGITWHYVTEHIDCGDIIVQKTMDIVEDTTAFDIIREEHVLSIEGFKEFIDILLYQRVPVKKMPYSAEDFIYHSRNLPMDGILTVNCRMEQSIRLLRSFDYKGMDIVPRLKLFYLNRYYTIKNYEICENLSNIKQDNFKEEISLNGDIFVRKAEGKILTLYLENM